MVWTTFWWVRSEINVYLLVKTYSYILNWQVLLRYKSNHPVSRHKMLHNKFYSGRWHYLFWENWCLEKVKLWPNVKCVLPIIIGNLLLILVQIQNEWLLVLQLLIFQLIFWHFKHWVHFTIHVMPILLEGIPIQF